MPQELEREGHVSAAEASAQGRLTSEAAFAAFSTAHLVMAAAAIQCRRAGGRLRIAAQAAETARLPARQRESCLWQRALLVTRQCVSPVLPAVESVTCSEQSALARLKYI